MTNAFCASVNFDAFMPRLLAQPRKSEAENSSSKRSSFQVAEHRHFANERINSPERAVRDHASAYLARINGIL
jgi:hypothetical protein